VLPAAACFWMRSLLRVRTKSVIKNGRRKLPVARLAVCKGSA
jgi:hypothetical protein